MNLLKETLEVLEYVGKKPEDIEWCGSPEYGWFTWDEFVKIANIEYYEGAGAQKIAKDLVIIGKDW